MQRFMHFARARLPLTPCFLEHLREQVPIFLRPRFAMSSFSSFVGRWLDLSTQKFTMFMQGRQL